MYATFYNVKKKLANTNSDWMQAYIESLIRFGSTRTRLLTFLNHSRSSCW